MQEGGASPSRSEVSLKWVCVGLWSAEARLAKTLIKTGIWFKKNKKQKKETNLIKPNFDPVWSDFLPQTSFAGQFLATV